MNWFQIDNDIASKPEVRRIVRTSREEVATVVGRLALFWCLVDRYGDLVQEDERPREDLDGLLPDYTVADLEEMCGGKRQFWELVIETGWLFEDGKGLWITGFHLRFSENAKRRLAANKRKIRQRLREDGTIPVTSVTRKRDIRKEESRGDKNIPPPKRGGRRSLFWRQLVDDPDRLKRAVSRRQVTFFREAWQEACNAPWGLELDDRDTRRKFLAACYYVTHPPAGMRKINNPVKVLRQKLIKNDWKTGRLADGKDDDWARDMERRLEGNASRPRTSNLDVAPEGDRRAELLAQTAELKKREQGCSK